jgi:hypothetical protein
MPPLNRKIREAMDHILRATQPPGDLEPAEPAKRVILGFLQDGRRLLKALLVLGGSDLDDVGDSLPLVPQCPRGRG